ncbi:MAG: GNAT family N-acetyltransferase [SAR324 cluster bacterium]|nr:GNAT family N-acetyltransferase [SAR324 cluster bacterium]
MSEITFSFAGPEDLSSVQALLAECDLPFQDLVEHLPSFILAKSGSQLVGVVGLEILNTNALLRSLAVSSSYRKKGLANELFARILAYARQKGIKQLFLLTETAEKFFLNAGFEKTARNLIPQSIRMTGEFRELCPETAIAMAMVIDDD